MGAILQLGGVRFQTDISLPGIELEPEGYTDARLEEGTCPFLDFLEDDQEFSLPGGHVRLKCDNPLRGRLAEGPRFEVSDSSRVLRIFSASPPSLQRTHDIVDGIVPLYLSTLPGLVLHGAVLGERDSAIAVLGESYCGKSTLTAHFVATGGAFLSDDWFRLTIDNGSCIAHPSHPAIRLRSREVVALDETKGALLESSPGYSKLWYRFARHFVGFRGLRTPLRAIVFLDRIEASTGSATLTELASGAAFLRVVSHLILAQLHSPDRWRERLILLFQVVESLPSYQLAAPSGEAGLQASRVLLTGLLRSTSPRRPPPTPPRDEAD